MRRCEFSFEGRFAGCCIYKKPKQRFDESSESESDECENCFGHVEVKNQKKTEKSGDESTAGTSKDVALDHVQPITPSSELRN